MQGTRREGRGGIGERRRGEEARMPGKERKVAELAMASAGGGGGQDSNWAGYGEANGRRK